MKIISIIDAGPLVALLNRRERHHAWTVEVMQRLEPPFLTCESVLSESCYILKRSGHGSSALMDLLSRDFVIPDFSLREEAPAVAKLMAQYSDVPMSLADACLVRMSEIHAASRIITLDTDFKIYRRRSRQAIPLIIP